MIDPRSGGWYNGSEARVPGIIRSSVRKLPGFPQDFPRNFRVTWSELHKRIPRWEQLSAWKEEDQQDWISPDRGSSPDSSADRLTADESTTPGGDEERAPYLDYGALFDSPDFSSLIKGRRTRQAREYETKVKSVLKSGAIGALRNGNFPDSAAIFKYGPGFAAATGDLADVSEHTRKAIDILTAPENPYIAWGFVAFGFLAQLYRNHETLPAKITESRREARRFRKEHPESAQKSRRNVEIRLPFGRRINLRVGFKVNPLKSFGFAFRARSLDPDTLAVQVFSDEKLISALKKLNIEIMRMDQFNGQMPPR